jgi:TolA-binding protein
MKAFFLLFCFMLSMSLSSCSSITVLRTKEIREISESSAASINQRMDSLMLEQNRQLSRLVAELSDLSGRVNNQGDKYEARMEEINFRLDRILGNVQQRSTGARVAAVSERSAEQEHISGEMESLYNASRSDYLRGQYAVAYNGFKQIYESLKTGEMAENSLYWMGMCMLDAGRKGDAETLFKSLLSSFPKSAKVCTVNFKLANMAEEAKNKEEQKDYLQRLLGAEHCTQSNEFQRAADILQRLN